MNPPILNRVDKLAQMCLSCNLLCDKASVCNVFAYHLQEIYQLSVSNRDCEADCTLIIGVLFIPVIPNSGTAASWFSCFLFFLSLLLSIWYENRLSKWGDLWRFRCPYFIWTTLYLLVALLLSYQQNKTSPVEM